MGIDIVTVVRMEVFEYQFEGQHWYFNVERAYGLAKRLGYNTHIIRRDMQKGILNVNEVDPEKVKNADVRQPGIAMLLEHEKAPISPFAVLIDGSHRCARAYQDNVDWSAYLLPPLAYEIVGLKADEMAEFMAQIPPEERTHG